MTANHKGTALHLGLNHVDPDHYQGWDGELAGCQNDARDLQATRRPPASRRRCSSTSKRRGAGQGGDHTGRRCARGR